MTSKEKITLLREKMREENIDAFVVFSADPHMSEYLPGEWKERAWLTGFTGSAGFAVVTQDKAGLWTDGRYFIQAPKELEGSGIDLMKMGVDGVPDYISWVKSEVKEGGVLAMRAIAAPHKEWIALKEGVKDKNIEVRDLDLLRNLWTDRGEVTKNPVFVHPIERAGVSVSEKLKAIRAEMKKQGATSHVIASLDDVAWTLNLRGSDVECNPVFLGYIFLTLEGAALYVDLGKVDEKVKSHLKEANVELKPYEDFYKDLQNVQGSKVLVSPASNHAIFVALEGNETIEAAVPGNLMKAIKNETELEGFRTVMVRDGVAMVKFLYWLTKEVKEKDLTEYSIGEKLAEFRAQGENFVGISFGSIVGYNGNDAIPHYSASKDASETVTAKGSILVDSGGQYLEGTTDITRTFPLGEVSKEYIHDSTLVLKGMIQLSRVKFPKGTKGVHLDAIARMALWMEGKEYNHGTGHGVGSFMNVHEGPQNIRKDMNFQDLIPGMVVSNEPGLYIENKYGIRHENLIAVKESESTQFGEFYEFETLTICPFFTSVIDKDLLDEKEISWLNSYHQWVGEKLLKHLEGEEKKWLEEMIAPI